MGRYLFGGPVNKFSIERKEGKFSEDEINKWKHLLSKTFHPDLFEITVKKGKITGILKKEKKEPLKGQFCTELEKVMIGMRGFIGPEEYEDDEDEEEEEEIMETSISPGWWFHEADDNLKYGARLYVEFYPLLGPFGKMCGEEDEYVAYILNIFATAALKDKLKTAVCFTIYG